jgi:hypothetical protein
MDVLLQGECVKSTPLRVNTSCTVMGTKPTAVDGAGLRWRKPQVAAVVASCKADHTARDHAGPDAAPTTVGAAARRLSSCTT